MTMNKNDYLTAEEYTALLDKATNGTVKLLGDFRTLNGTYKYHCSECNYAFWNRGYRMLANEDSGQNHVCSTRYATIRGQRFKDTTKTPALR